MIQAIDDLNVEYGIKEHFLLFRDETGEHKFILSYDDYGCLDHIYDENWETMEDGKKKMLYENAEEEIGVFQLKGSGFVQ